MRIRLMDLPWYKPGIKVSCAVCLNDIKSADEVGISRGLTFLGAPKSAYVCHYECMKNSIKAQQDGHEPDTFIPQKMNESTNTIKLDITRDGKVIGTKELNKAEWHKQSFEVTPLDKIPNSLEEWCNDSKNGNRD